MPASSRLSAAYLGLCQSLYQPLEAREAHGEEAVGEETYLGSELVLTGQWLLKLSKRVARDLAGTEPERVAPPRLQNTAVRHSRATGESQRYRRLSTVTTCTRYWQRWPFIDGC